MLQDGYKDHYSFDSHAECCKVSKFDLFPAKILSTGLTVIQKAHYCAEIRGVVQS